MDGRAKIPDYLLLIQHPFTTIQIGDTERWREKQREIEMEMLRRDMLCFSSRSQKARLLFMVRKKNVFLSPEEKISFNATDNSCLWRGRGSPACVIKRYFDPESSLHPPILRRPSKLSFSLFWCRRRNRLDLGCLKTRSTCFDCSVGDESGIGGQAKVTSNLDKQLWKKKF